MKKLIPIIIFLLFSACREEVINENSDYIGDWSGPNSNNSSLTIDSKSNLYYKGRNSLGEKTVEFGGKAYINGTKLHVSGYIFGYNFTIVTPPTLMSSPLPNQTNYHWYMRLQRPGYHSEAFYKE